MEVEARRRATSPFTNKLAFLGGGRGWRVRHYTFCWRRKSGKRTAPPKKPGPEGPCGDVELPGHILGELLLGHLSGSRPATAPGPLRVWEWRRLLVLEPEERPVLQMSCRDELPPAEATRLLRRQGHQVRAVKETALQKIRQAAGTAGLRPGDPGATCNIL